MIKMNNGKIECNAELDQQEILEDAGFEVGSLDSPKEVKEEKSTPKKVTKKIIKKKA